MNKNFWQQLKSELGRPLYVLAPMINVTDAAFRAIIAAHGKPDAFFTEFTSVDGLCSEGREALMENLWFGDAERPVVMQIFGSKPENFYRAALLGRELGFAGIDINMGCPDKAVIKQEAGAALIRTPQLAQEIIRATQEGADGLPVSVKTRIGFNENVLEEWVPALLEAKPAALTIHARTKKEMSDVPARWESVGRTVEIRNEMKSDALIIGNGDVLDLADAAVKVAASQADGAMLGRAIFGNPWAFNPHVHKSNLPHAEILRVMVEHAELFEKMFGPGTRDDGGSRKNFLIMRKHLGAYVSGFPRSKKLRARLMETTNAQQVKTVVEWYVSSILPEIEGTPEVTAKPQTWKPNYS